MPCTLHAAEPQQTLPPDPIRIDGARGPLSSAQSALVIARLNRGAVNTDIFDRHLAIEQAIVGSPLTVGNQVVLLQDGPATYQAMFASIMAARDHINMETYIFDDDEVGQRFAQAFIEKQRQGVQVNIIRDSAGTFSVPAAFFQPLIDSGIKILEFNPLNPLITRKAWEVNRRDHRKLLIVDGNVAYLGGINVSSVYSGGSFGKTRRAKKEGALEWRDTDIEIKGPAVAELQRLFIAAWNSQKGDELSHRAYFPQQQTVGRQVVRAIGSSPDESFSSIFATLLSAIANAENNINITNAYFAPDPQLMSALTTAAMRGVDVKLILPSQTDSWLIFHAGRSFYEPLLIAGVKIFERRGVILHSKTALVDGVWATVGSTNLDWRSLVHNHELNAVILGTEFGGQVQTMFDKDLKESDEIKLIQWRSRSLKFKLQEQFARLWQYWL
jgi:cardiolipin synthase A/B